MLESERLLLKPLSFNELVYIYNDKIDDVETRIEPEQYMILLK
ncbi:hypothetical protein [Clostridium sp. C2-6-12]|nr:hypothetical protein [Clostridium sp. C2-6-12]